MGEIHPDVKCHCEFFPRRAQAPKRSPSTNTLTGAEWRACRSAILWLKSVPTGRPLGPKAHPHRQRHQHRRSKRTASATSSMVRPKVDCRVGFSRSGADRVSSIAQRFEGVSALAAPRRKTAGDSCQSPFEFPQHACVGLRLVGPSGVSAASQPLIPGRGSPPACSFCTGHASSDLRRAPKRVTILLCGDEGCPFAHT